MSEKTIALRVIGRLKSDNPNRWPYTPPEPTHEQTVDWLVKQMITPRIASGKRFIAEQPPRHGVESVRQDVIELERLREIVQRAYEAGELTTAEYERILADRYLSQQEIWDLADSIKHWQPAYVITMPNGKPGGAKVYEMLDEHHRPFELTYEDGQWYRHKGPAFPPVRHGKTAAHE